MVRRLPYVDNPDKPYKWRVFWSYLPDWIICIFLWGIFYLIDKIDGYRRVFSVTDTSLAHPYAEHERVPVWMLAVLFGIVPAVIMLLCAAIQRSFWDAHNAILGFILSLGLCVTFTDIVKITVGRPRPDLFSRCQLPPSLTQNPVHGLTSWTACTQFEDLKEGFRSFPSGHSSFAWSGMWYLTLYLAAKFRTLNRKGYTIKSWILLAPITGATLVSVSRTMDYRHHATDVIAGAIVGVLTSWWGYRQYYPPVSAPKSWKTYDPRIKNPDSTLPMHAAHAIHEREASDSIGLVNTKTSYPSPPGVVYPPQRIETPYSPIEVEAERAQGTAYARGNGYDQRLE